ncbi:hypothetical protein L3Y34_012581 [Caenorhabditis briggsae]|uniref:Uncharacterized protein n=1 Tax=Caenorhabditis briggsae TaxID=6238 RepID=A0AAE8ZUH4_CAEBR|nr:hypothetical protein L3Y34_012581 [Caenorhabditis briggsae]
MEAMLEFFRGSVALLPKETADQIKNEFANLFVEFEESPTDVNMNKFITAFQEIHIDLSHNHGVIFNSPTLEELVDLVKDSVGDIRQYLKDECNIVLTDADVNVKYATAATAETIDDPRMADVFDWELLLSRNVCCREHHDMYQASVELFSMAVENINVWRTEFIEFAYNTAYCDLFELVAAIEYHMYVQNHGLFD